MVEAADFWDFHDRAVLDNLTLRFRRGLPFLAGGWTDTDNSAAAG
jgi:hypothetical protein